MTDSHGNSVPAQLEGVAEICFIGTNPTSSSSRKYDSSPIECTSFFRAKFFDSVLEKSSTLGLVSLVYLSSALGLALNHDNKTNPFLFHRLTGFKIPVHITQGILTLPIYAFSSCPDPTCKSCKSKLRSGPVGAELRHNDPTPQNIVSLAHLSKRTHFRIALRANAPNRLTQPLVRSDAGPLGEMEKDISVKIDHLQQNVHADPHRVPRDPRVTKRTVSMKWLHEAYGHVPDFYLRATHLGIDSPYLVKEIKWHHDLCQCDGCQNRLRRIMHHSRTIKSREDRLEQPLSCFSRTAWDLKGDVKPLAILTKKKWILVYVCCDTSHIIHFTYHKKSEAYQSVRPFLQACHKNGWKVKHMHSDFDSLWQHRPSDKVVRKFRNEIDKVGLELWKFSISVTYSFKNPQDNQVAELAILKTTTAANSLLINKMLHGSFWELGFSLAVRILTNLVNPNHFDPRMRTKTPCQVFSGSRQGSIDAAHMQIFGSQVLVVADRVRPGQFGHKVVKPGQRIWVGFPEDPVTGEVSVPRGALTFRLNPAKLELATHYWIIEKSQLEIATSLIDMEKNVLRPLNKGLYRRLAKHLQEIYLDPSKIPDEVFTFEDTILRHVLHEDLTVPSHMPLIDLPDPDETEVSDEEGELLSDDEPIYDPRAHERLDFTTDDESQDRESKGNDREFDSEEELDEDLLQEVQHHRRNQIADHDRRLEEKVGENEPATASPLSAADPELSEAKENPGIYRKFRERTAVPPKMFEDDTYQFLGRQIQRYFEETKQNHLGRVTKILTPKEGDEIQEPLFHILYDDGDEEDLTRKELRTFLLPRSGERKSRRRLSSLVTIQDPVHPSKWDKSRSVYNFLVSSDSKVVFHNHGGNHEFSIPDTENSKGTHSKRYKSWKNYCAASSIGEALDLGAKPRELVEDVLRGRLFVDKCAFSNHRDGINPLAMIASQPVENIDLNNFNVNDQINIEHEFSQGSSRQIYKIGSRVRTIDNEFSTPEYGRVTSWDSARSLYTVSLDEAPSTVRSFYSHSLSSDPSSLENSFIKAATGEFLRSQIDEIPGYAAVCCENQISSDLFERVKARVDIMENARAGKKFSSTESDIDAADFERLLIFGEAALQAVASETYTPKNHKDAMKCEEGELWYDSEYEEFAQMLDMNCFKLITKSEMKKLGLRQIGAGYVYRCKNDSAGNLTRRKSRYVCRGYEQREGIDFAESYASVVCYSTIRLLMALGAQTGYLLTQYDVRNAFISAPLAEDEQLCVKLPPNWEDPRFGDFFDLARKEGAENCTLLCVMSVYGLVQAPRSFRNRLDYVLREKMGMTPCVQDDCLYTLNHPEHGMLRFATYIDDGLLLSRDRAAAEFFHQLYASHFELSPGSGEEVNHFLGMTIDRSGNFIKLSNKLAIDNLLREMEPHLDRSNTYTVKTPGFENQSLVPNTGTRYTEEQFPYRHICGCCLHLSRTCRPDLAWAVSELSRHLNNVGDEQIRHARRLLYYLRGTSDLGIVYSPLPDGDPRTLRLITFGDSDWAGDQTTRKSRTGYVNMLSNAGIEWYSKGQTLISDSSCMAETISACEAMRSIIHFRIVMIELGFKQTGSSILYGDNQATVLNSASKKQSPKSKHFQIRTELLRAITRSGKAHILKIGTKDNLSDLYTKQMGTELFESLRAGNMGHTSDKAKEMCGL